MRNAELIDDLGEPVPVAEEPRRVVSLVPSLTEAVEVSAPGRIVAATDYCTHPSTLDVPRVGGSKYPKLDRILAAEPDLVLANSEENRPEDVEALRANGIPVFVMAAAESVPAALGSLRRILTQVFAVAEPEWLVTAEDLWREVEPVRHRAVIPVWRKPWVVLGRDTFAGDVLRRVGIENVYSRHSERYPRPPLAELTETGADLVVLPDEPYEFTQDDGPGFFPRMRPVLVSGRYLSWYGPSLVDAYVALRESVR
ncbi:helical backbone metal receptor [Amycolatopsis jiangsuensis]|uniref:ABC-type Fe3+-hydroxamate transport system substrate-binding protein n=1 Tax=Amycolatopsis jiangsuensis TaxID=1181879 RepID=A0A840IXN3_9PSEU|nr:helical backbone metal receptor [Amycolatopsis jiangsuensis]MBB4685972.1 ABC-type Fe3+-hydroxamate transport system substrate-binding protein [Amycolatopsis jiangsuensis]